MSASPIRRRSTHIAVAALLSLAFLAGCTGQQTAKDNYADTEDNFIEGCVTTADDDDASGDATTQIADPGVYCQCVLDALSHTDTGVPFSEFKSINTDLSDNGGTLPESFIETYAECDPSATS